ncbi:hypothetical protein ILP97_17485 [Amycolatopsis sp. H6(2020)]|nr:hypothetical protein [Amycolatopsis sp. H6(2020)]
MLAVHRREFGGLRLPPPAERGGRRVELPARLVGARLERVAAAVSGLGFQQVCQPQRDQFPLVRGQILKRRLLPAAACRRGGGGAGRFPAMGVVHQERECDRHPLTVTGGDQRDAAQVRFRSFHGPLVPVEHQRGSRRQIQRARHRAAPISV